MESTTPFAKDTVLLVFQMEHNAFHRLSVNITTISIHALSRVLMVNVHGMDNHVH